MAPSRDCLSRANHLTFRSIYRTGRVVHGGETGIRTLGPREGSTVFETAPFDRSGTSPRPVSAGCNEALKRVQPGRDEKSWGRGTSAATHSGSTGYRVTSRQAGCGILQSSRERWMRNILPLGTLGRTSQDLRRGGWRRQMFDAHAIGRGELRCRGVVRCGRAFRNAHHPSERALPPWSGRARLPATGRDRRGSYLVTTGPDDPFRKRIPSRDLTAVNARVRT